MDRVNAVVAARSNGWPESSSPGTESRQEKYQCPRCPSSFKRPEHLKRHQRSHDGHKPFVCSVCLKRFFRSDILTRHELMHLALQRGSDGNALPRKRACTECARARERCSRDEPCLRCASKALVCLYPDDATLSSNRIPSMASSRSTHANANGTGITKNKEKMEAAVTDSTGRTGQCGRLPLSLSPLDGLGARFMTSSPPSAALGEWGRGCNAEGDRDYRDDAESGGVFHEFPHAIGLSDVDAENRKSLLATPQTTQVALYAPDFGSEGGQPPPPMHSSPSSSFASWVDARPRRINLRAYELIASGFEELCLKREHDAVVACGSGDDISVSQRTARHEILVKLYYEHFRPGVG
ncbi:hypothetical protein GGS23DRAFT_505210 [Durotheca rogersii]|uniref:uncharacterized protein n=1 Tax=Durotheca rogersii TaxID=419775 RepID=UPI00222067B9|nr:uncharacterized protein GGS23DRAFT_505210 [Durotheca rogersii]KAI5853635.1 hypothetical protein GGS23DRAFT_505210 [Durotheca rogersii]